MIKEKETMKIVDVEGLKFGRAVDPDSFSAKLLEKIKLLNKENRKAILVPSNGENTRKVRQRVGSYLVKWKKTKEIPKEIAVRKTVDDQIAVVWKGGRAV